jgi:hypothetical protein
LRFDYAMQRLNLRNVGDDSIVVDRVKGSSKVENLMSYGRKTSRFSFSLRTLLIVITLIAVGIVWWQRTRVFEQRRQVHDEAAQQYADIAWGMQRFSGFSEAANREAQPFWEQHQYHADLVAQYQRAAWLGFVPAPEEGGPPHQDLLQ